MAIRGKEKVAVGDDAAMEAVGKIASIFNFWDRDQDGFWSADEANASPVDDSEIAQQDWGTPLRGFHHHKQQSVARLKNSLEH
ncbi:hypothetical protein DIPPA_16323 [Diplonema papillatum]|nr:hypothetical protein DIPPA_16323 [Diplonema papillatum]|eukprot:gene18992-29256_t